jgi:hypothetical protein
MKLHKLTEPYSLAIGRWQTLPPHEGHVKLIQTLFDEGKNVVIDIRTMPKDDSNPYTANEIHDEWMLIFPGELMTGQLILRIAPNIVEVVYGRTPGWGIREVVLDEETQKISATEIRKNNKDK